MADGYKLLTMGYLIVLSVMGVLRKRGFETVGLLCFMMFFAVSTMLDRLDFWYEPVYLGFGAEYGGFLLLLVLGITILYESLQLRKRNALLLQKEIHARKHMAVSYTHLDVYKRQGRWTRHLDEHPFQIRNGSDGCGSIHRNRRQRH